MRCALAFLLVGVLLAACSPYKPDLPAEPFLCGSTPPQCPEGYACQAVGAQQVCVDTSGTAPDGGNGDGNNNGCQDDHMLEPNDTPAQAFQTPVASQQNMIKFAQLAICPAGDIDMYKVDIVTGNQNLTALIEFDPAGTPLQVDILNAGGATIGGSMPVSGMANMAQAMVPNLPAGTAYAKVYAAQSGMNGDYKLTLTVTN